MYARMSGPPIHVLTCAEIFVGALVSNIGIANATFLAIGIAIAKGVADVVPALPPAIHILVTLANVANCKTKN